MDPIIGRELEEVGVATLGQRDAGVREACSSVTDEVSFTLGE